MSKTGEELRREATMIKQGAEAVSAAFLNELLMLNDV